MPNKRNYLQKKSDKRSVNRLIIIFSVVFTVAIVVALIAWQGTSEQELNSDQTRIFGVHLSEFEGRTESVGGLYSPTVDGYDFSGQSVSIENNGRPKVIIFLAHWCSHCQEEAKLLKKYFSIHGISSEVDGYAVATAIDSNKPNYPPDKWLERESWPYQIISDTSDDSIAKAFGVNSFPYWVLVDSEGKVLSRVKGSLTENEIAQTFTMMSGR